MTLRDTMFWIGAIICIVAELAIVRSVLVGRAASGANAVPGHPGSTPRPRRGAEIAWALLPAVGLLFILYLTWRAVADTHRPAGGSISHNSATFGA